MNLTQIKTKIGQPVLTMVRQLDETTKEKTQWLSHWDNDNRVRVTMHEEVFNQILQDKDFGGLAFKTEIVKSEGKQPYTRYVVITPKNIEATL